MTSASATSSTTPSEPARDSLFPERNSWGAVAFHMKLSELSVAPSATAHVTVVAPARLHLGFVDPDGSLGRPFGSLGLTIDGPATRIALRHAARDSIDAEADTQDVERASAHIVALKRLFRRDASLAIELREVLPAHAGFGSGTQLALALGRGFASLHGIDVATADLARALGRGKRSGIGVAAFDRGGFLVDGGPGKDAPAPLLARAEFPEQWRVLLVLDPRGAGLHGEDEGRVLSQLAPMPRATAAHIAHLVLMQILPALHESDFAPFAQGVSEVQRVIGAHFAPAQRAGAYTSAEVAQVVEWLGANFDAAIGQSSWGPTGFAILASQADADRAVDRARAAGQIAAPLALRIVKGRNHGALLTR
jgi:beta-ribofuranosylaminobenzene 5'-phosphate synthase